MCSVYGCFMKDGESPINELVATLKTSIVWHQIVPVKNPTELFEALNRNYADGDTVRHRMYLVGTYNYVSRANHVRYL